MFKDTILGAVGIAAVIGGIWWFSREPSREVSEPKRSIAEVVKEFKAKQAATAPAGWPALQTCEPFTSADGKTELTFKRDQTLKRGAEAGNWSYDAAGERYVVSVGYDTKSYTLFDYSSVELCVLVSGTEASADLEASWFSNYRTSTSDEDDIQDDREPEARYR